MNMSRLSEDYKNTIKNKMMEKFHYRNMYQIPKIYKIVLNMGIGEAKEDEKIQNITVWKKRIVCYPAWRSCMECVTTELN